MTYSFAKLIVALPVALLISTSSLLAAVENAPFQIGANTSSETMKFAVSEFQNLASEISKRHGMVLQDPFLNRFVTHDVVLISGRNTLQLVQAFKEAGIGHLNDIPVNPDGFVVRSTTYKDHDILIIASRSDVGALYGVYDYFEQYCGAGYFFDGDYLPQRPLRFEGVLRISDPPLAYRGTSAWTAHRGLSRNFPSSWEFSHWERFLKWMAKKKMNLLAGYEIDYTHHGGDINRLAFPDVYKTFPPGPPAGADIYDVSLHWIQQTWMRDLIAQRKLTQQVFKFGRMLGVRFANTYDYGKVYLDYREKHPDHHYLSSLVKGYYHIGKTWDSLLPGTPECNDYTYRLWKTYDDVYGTNGLWRIGWFTELWKVQGKSVADMRIMAAHEQSKIIRRIDPQANILIDTWGMFEQWSKEDQLKFWNGLPKDMGVIIFSRAPGKDSNYFEGHKWIFNMWVGTFAGDVQLHGFLDRNLSMLREVLAAPKGRKDLLGFVHGSETLENALYTQLSAEMSWQTDKLERDEFLRHYARSRYGDRSFDNMHESVKALVLAMQMHDLNSDGCDGRTVMERCAYYLTSDYHEPWRYGQADQGLRKALRYALKEADHQAGNVLYHNYIMELAWQLLEDRFRFEYVPLGKAYRKYLASDDPQEMERARETVKRHAENISNLYKDIISLLSTDPDYSLSNDIDRLMAQEGTNPFTPRQIQRWSIVPYCASQAVECYRDYYYPHFRLCMSEVEKCFNENKKIAKPLESKEFKKRAEDLFISFFDKPLQPVAAKDKERRSLDVIKGIYNKYALRAMDSDLWQPSDRTIDTVGFE